MARSCFPLKCFRLAAANPLFQVADSSVPIAFSRKLKDSTIILRLSVWIFFVSSQTFNRSSQSLSTSEMSPATGKTP